MWEQIPRFSSNADPKPKEILTNSNSRKAARSRSHEEMDAPVGRNNTIVEASDGVSSNKSL